MAQTSQDETEIKLRLADRDAFTASLASHRFTLLHPRVFEINIIYDTEDGALRKRGELIRLRSVEGRLALLTYKGPVKTDLHKSREEIEVSVSEYPAAERILNRLGLSPRFRYEKYRTEYSAGEGVVTVDETPIGDFAELEGDSEWIDRTAAALGFSASQYITESYSALYLKYCESHSLSVRDMTFPPDPEGKKP